MPNPFNIFSIIQTALIFCVFILSAVIVTSIQVWLNKKAGDYSADVVGYDPMDVMAHVDIFNFLMYLVTGFFITRSAPTNHKYIRAKYRSFVGWLIILAPALLSILLAFILFCFSNIFIGSFATDLALHYYQAPLLEILPQALPEYSSFSLVVLTIISISVICQILTGVIMIINYTVTNVITERFDRYTDDEMSMQQLLTYTITLLLLITIIGPSVNLILKSFFYIKYLALSVLKVLA